MNITWQPSVAASIRCIPFKLPERLLDRHARFDIVPQHGPQRANGGGLVVPAVGPPP
jgi:hypothetical protein